MKLTRVTITGADDSVDPKAIYDLSREFPFAEWGILRSMKLNDVTGGGWYTTCAPRYPTQRWRDSLCGLTQVRGAINLAAHLCGEISRLTMAGEDCWFYSDSNRYQRIQLNGFSKYRLPMLRVATRHPEVQWILQTGDLASEHHATELENLHPNVTHLLDSSGGRGQYGVWAERHDPRVGYAGGIGPDNIVETLKYLLAYKAEQEFWIDMESGVRTDDRFDLAKARRVLELAKPFVEAP